jgi:hypothetical protein
MAWHTLSPLYQEDRCHNGKGTDSIIMSMQNIIIRHHKVGAIAYCLHIWVHCFCIGHTLFVHRSLFLGDGSFKPRLWSSSQFKFFYTQAFFNFVRLKKIWVNVSDMNQISQIYTKRNAQFFLLHLYKHVFVVTFSFFFIKEIFNCTWVEVEH